MQILDLFENIQIEPLPTPPICPIQYPQDYKTLISILKNPSISNEKSLRTLKLTEELILLNPSHYSIWYTRANIVDACGDWPSELDFVSRVGLDNSKCYQVWGYRQTVIEKLLSNFDFSMYTNETLYIDLHLDIDAKNYHAWTYRQWVIRTFGMSENVKTIELALVEKLLSEDVYNNSAWNHRYFVGFFKGFELGLADEIDYTVGKIRLCKDNESAWNYLDGLINKGGNIQSFYSELIEYGRFGRAFKVDILERRIQSNPENVKELKAEASESCSWLAKEDPIRMAYWQFRGNCFD